ncbi:hypothetical protein EV641_12560 [Rhodococcus sp. SMB37]|uniref:hypothetical protein n=1 Tax=Rhodococcus sp. SMB37 TaxID=2512213 RepID=UPI001042D8D9|nr:hypothetical protein [Rhodococcus sp. SMB37]TCN43868.1 hypothetical protein EV641_12560 [Rhodococcus sp. SMB37]
MSDDEQNHGTPSASDGSDPNPDGKADSERAEYFSGEKGRTVPKAAWWVLAVALVVLLAFFLVRPAWFTRDADDHSLQVPADRHFVKTLAGSGHADGVWLTDDSPSTSYLVTLPADSGRSRTRLQLAGTSQIPDNSTVFLSVSMDGQQVFNNKLAAGDTEIETYIDVPEQIAADGRVRVQIRADGTRHDETCTPDHSAGLQIHLDPDSTVEAALDEPIRTVRDAVVSWDRNVTIVLADQGTQWRTAAAQMGIALTRAGHEVTFASDVPESDERSTILIGPDSTLREDGWSGPDGSAEGIAVGRLSDSPVLGVTTPDGAAISRYLTSPAITTADGAAADPAAISTPPLGGDQVALEALGADPAVGQITETRRWRIGYSLADLPEGRLPQSVSANFQLPDSPDDLRWILNVDLNGTLVASQSLNDTAGRVMIPLPPASELLENTLTLSVERDRDLGGCDVRVTSYPIQLQADSALGLGADPGAGFTAVSRILAPGFAVYLPGNSGENVVEQLNAIIPTLTEFIPAGENPDFRWNEEPAAGQPFILVGTAPDVSPLVSLTNGRIVAGPDNAALDIPAFDNGLLVEAVTGAGGAGGVMIQPRGSIGHTELPDFGRETAQVITPQGSFTINGDGTVSTEVPPRQDLPR